MMSEKTAAVFPGQGTQRPGMGKDFYDNIGASREAFDEASEALGWDVAALCFGNDDKINMTEYAQPCILATEIAMLRGLRFEYGFSPEYFGGHSLGEYAAMVAADVMPFAEALQTVHIRGRLMQQATPPGIGAMAALIAENLDVEQIRNVLEGLPIDVANINSADQVVISGRADVIALAEERLKSTIGGEKELRFVALNVSAPFHSRFMMTIKDTFRDVLNTVAAKLNPTNAERVTSNVTGRFHTGGAESIIDTLVSQISNSVNWRGNMQALAEKAGTIYEIGPNRPLKNFFKSIGVTCRSITTLSAARREFAQSVIG
jgi:[acyl-carrier-protein] S-malonyltransferase/trans-AT polyketide synthase/acyltransferase/oxidoreductase domain-containing protein